MGFEIAFPPRLSIANLERRVWPRLTPLRQRISEEAMEGRACFDLTRVESVDTWAILDLVLSMADLGFIPIPEFAIKVPSSGQATEYLKRLNFFAALEGELRRLGRVSWDPGVSEFPRDGWMPDVILRIHRLNKYGNINEMVSEFETEGIEKLRGVSRYSREEAGRFIAILSELCQNLFDHSGSWGMVFASCALWPKNGKFLKLFVFDKGMGISRSLAPRYGKRYGEKWTDLTAIGMALGKGVSRSPERGYGLFEVKRLVKAMKGALAVRSGAAKLHLTDRVIEKQADLPYLPGTQVKVVLPLVS